MFQLFITVALTREIRDLSPKSMRPGYLSPLNCFFLASLFLHFGLRELDGFFLLVLY